MIECFQIHCFVIILIILTSNLLPKHSMVNNGKYRTVFYSISIKQSITD